MIENTNFVYNPKKSAEVFIKELKERRIGKEIEEDIVGGNNGIQKYRIKGISYIDEGQQLIVVEKRIRTFTSAPKGLRGEIGESCIKYYYYKIVQKLGKQVGTWKYGESCPNMACLRKLNNLAIKEGTLEISDII